MFDILSWFYRYIFIFLLACFLLVSISIYFYNKRMLQPFLSVIIIVTAASSFALLSIWGETIDYKAVYIGLIFCLKYIIARILLIKLLRIKDILLYDIVNMLLAVGLAMLYRLSPDYAVRQSLFTILGDTTYFFLFYLLKKIDIKKDYSKQLGLVILVTLIITQFWGISISGSKNWIEVLGYRFQPSEFLKILFVIYISAILSRGLAKNIFLYSSSSIVIAASFFALQRDLGSALIFSAVYLILLFVTDDKIYPTLLSAAAASVMAVISFYTFSHIKSRVEAWLNPWRYVSGKSYQVTQSLFAIAAGGLLGTGLNLGNPKFIPAVHTDFIFSAICEETGIISGIIMLSLLCMATLIGLNFSKNCKEPINRLICLGLSSMTGIQTLIIVSGVLNIIPITGVTLPFVSYGGSSLISQTMNIGILYFVSMNEKGDKDE
ncbi:MAG TPA: hypothetical protein DHV55_15610 [Clostridiaceae bacterium]|nr:hypothetical protein [Clostridiaceae bacterium]